MEKIKYEIVQIDAIAYDEDWVWNDILTTWEFVTRAKWENGKKAFTRYLRSKGITFRKGCTTIETDGDGWTIFERGTHRPLFHMREVCPF